MSTYYFATCRRHGVCGPRVEAQGMIGVWRGPEEGVGEFLICHAECMAAGEVRIEDEHRADELRGRAWSS